MINLRYYIKRSLRRITSSSLRRVVKRERRYLRQFINGERKNSLEDFYRLLVEVLGVRKGDRLFVSSSFGNLNAVFSPLEAIELLQSIVTESGLIVMPFYPPLNSDEWAKRDEIFDMLKTKSGMGVMTNVFSKMPDVYKSIHPTKAVCAWGNDAKYVTEGHEFSETPYFWGSPYGKLLNMGCKTLGLGVDNNPIFHSIEDVLLDRENRLYLREPFLLNVKTFDNKLIKVKTFIHDPKLIDFCVSSGKYIESHHFKCYQKVRFGLTFLFLVNNTELFNESKDRFKQGLTRLKK